MKKFFSILIVLFVVGMVVGGGLTLPLPAEQTDRQAPRQAAEAKDSTNYQPIDFKADGWGPLTPGDSATYMVGNFAAQHNGAVITADSTILYDERHLECFGHVLINKNTTYVYGDRAKYDGDRNEVHVYSDIIKVVDGDATLYTYEFVFNTLTNIGEFSNGGILTNGENRIEAQRGYYYSNEKQLIGVEAVQMQNEEYELKGDSVVYDMAADNAFFFENTHIWNKDGEYLYADRGEYHKIDTLYIVTRNGYLLTEKQEVWSDSIDYFRPQNHVILRHDLQLDDTDHKILSFGHYGEYWKEPGDAFLTRRPAVVSYDTEQGDSVFMRADTIVMHTINRAEQARLAEAEAARQAAEAMAEIQAREEGADGTAGATGDDTEANAEGAETSKKADMSRRAPHQQSKEDTTPESEEGIEGADSLANVAQDSTAMKPLNPLDTLQGADRKAYLKEQARKEQARRKAAAAAAKKAKLDTIAAHRRVKINAKLDAQKAREAVRDSIRTAKMQEKARRTLNARKARAARKGKPFGKVDAQILARLDSLSARLDSETDSISMILYDSLMTSLRIEQPILPTDTIAADSIYRIIKGFRNVRIFRTDFQVVCDSITSLSSDSTIHLHINPVLWNENNQITADSVTAFTERQKLVRAEFYGTPMMSNELDTVYYNQVTGKTMTAFFRDNAIYRNNVDGNAQTIYYMTDGEPPVVTLMSVIESGDMSFFFEEKQLVEIIYRANPTYQIHPVYPNYGIPEDQSLYLKGFHWEGDRRPTRDTVFHYEIRPSKREQIGRLRHPDFPIQKRVERDKERLIRQRRWADRIETVDRETTEWMHDLGYEIGQPRQQKASE